MPPVSSHDDWFLAEIAAFRIRNRLFRAAGFHHEAVFVNIYAVNRHACFDAKYVEYFKVARGGPGLSEKLAKLFAFFSRAKHIPARHV